MTRPESEHLRVDGDRLWDSLTAMAEVGATPRGGSCRLALTEEDRQGRDLFVKWCRQAGCEVTVDQMGNIFSRRPGRDSAASAVGTGSHLDTQPHGGRFDGVFGVLAGLEVIRTLNDLDVETRAPVDAVVWTNEEGSRFAPAMLGSSVFAGVFDLNFGLSRTDADGVSVGEALARIGYAGSACCGDRSFRAFFEAHIEQGPVLEREGNTIGVVLGGQGCLWLDLEVRGLDAHAGSTPMAGRRDALVAASAMVTAIYGLAHEHAPRAVATVGRLDVSPNSRNTIPGEVRFGVDIRHFESQMLDTLGRECEQRCRKIAGEHDVEFETAEIWRQPPVHFDEGCISAVRSAARSLGFASRDIVSGAGHDAFLVSTLAPTGMIFVPCAGGVSHNEEESATKEDLAAGCDVLLNAVVDRAGVAG